MRFRRGHRRPLPVRSVVPSIITVLALSAGLTAVRFALQERWELAVFAIIVAGIFDGLDGRFARLLNATSKFGAELDSLSDFVAFGAAPGIVIYVWALQDAGGWGWIAVLIYATSCALRLARFNIGIEDPNRPPFMSNFFTGVPAPGGAGLAIIPMMLSFQGLEAIFQSPYFVVPYLIGVGLLMVSSIPTFSVKRLRVRRNYILPVLLLAGLLAALLVSYPWIVLTCVGVVYLASIPFSFMTCRRMRAEYRVSAGPSPDAEATSQLDSEPEGDGD